MKSLLFTLLTVFGVSMYTQGQRMQLSDIVEAEAKSAKDIVNYRINLNTGNYDIKYHRLEFNVDPNAAFISGDVTTYFEAKENMAEITFDLADNMIVSGVQQRENSLSFEQNSDDELVVTLDETLLTGVLDSLTISYSGNPISSGFGSFEQSTHDGDPIIWTLSEPYGAKGWWPCKQDLNDKIDSIDVFLETPKFNPTNEEYIAVSNGLEQSQTDVVDQKITHFKHRYPIPAYLIAIAVTNYSVYTDVAPNNGNPIDIVNYVYPEDLATSQTETPVTVDIMELFTDLFETYPFEDEKYGHAQFGWGGGMEHTTVSFMNNFDRNLVAHELAHQWFGNKVTCGSWKDIWLNEGFATYLSGLVVEDFDGDIQFTLWKQNRINSITSQPGGAVYLSDQDTTSVSRIFNGRLSYSKGAMVLHMLRKKLGDVDFYAGLQSYLAHPDYAYDYAKTADFMAEMESTSGVDLDEFFDDWIYNEGYPTYTLEWHQDDSNLNMQLLQTQSDASVSFFEAPVPIKVVGTLGEQLDLVLDHNFSGETFSNTVNFTVENIWFDPAFDLISKNNSVVLGVNDVTIQSQLQIFPNPVNHILNVEISEGLSVSNILIYNTLGQLMSQPDFNSELNMSDLASGIHFIKFETSKGTITKSFLKK
ncbi:MAG: peptidase M1 [Bacteroidetes bacterium MedPE-SWsnd-G2]|nr:MAG: peptidase M1 [Bacteroidetes bacterium MedPE-SWsnd-G2]